MNHSHEFNTQQQELLNFTEESIAVVEDNEPTTFVFQLDHHIGSTLLTNFYRFIAKCKIPSLIIKTNNMTLTNDIMFHTKSQSMPQLLYRGTRDGFQAKDFHSKCDNRGPTLTIIKSADFNQIFGGFTTQSWKSPYSYVWQSDSSAFIFKIENSNSGDGNTNQLFRKFNIKQEEIQYATCNHVNCLPTFGFNYDILICTNCNWNNSIANLGRTYELPPNNEYYAGSKEAQNYLAGSYFFKVSEIEVFKIVRNNKL